MIRETRNAVDFGFKVGDILKACWGYDANIYNFYDIVEYDSKWSNGYQIDPKNHEDILNAREMKDLVEVCELLISQRKKLSSK